MNKKLKHNIWTNEEKDDSRIVEQPKYRMIYLFFILLPIIGWIGLGIYFINRWNHIKQIRSLEFGYANNGYIITGYIWWDNYGNRQMQPTNKLED